MLCCLEGFWPNCMQSEVDESKLAGLLDMLWNEFQASETVRCGKKRLRLWLCSQTTWGWWAKAFALFLPFNSLIHQTHQIELAQAVVLMFFVLLAQVPQGGDGKTGRGPPDWYRNDSATCSTAVKVVNLGVSLESQSPDFQRFLMLDPRISHQPSSDKLHKPLAIIGYKCLQLYFGKKQCIVCVLCLIPSGDFAAVIAWGGRSQIQSPWPGTQRFCFCRFAVAVSGFLSCDGQLFSLIGIVLYSVNTCVKSYHSVQEMLWLRLFSPSHPKQTNIGG